MELYEKIRQLESELYDAKPVPLSKKAGIDRDKCLSLLNEIKRAIPDDVYDLHRLAEEKRRLHLEAEEITARASKTAEKIIAEAELRAAVLVDESSLVRDAEYEADKIKRMALRDLEVSELKIRERIAGILIGADEYLTDTLDQIKATQVAIGIQIKQKK